MNLFGFNLTLPFNPAHMYKLEGHAYGINVPNPLPFIINYRADTEDRLNRSRAGLYENARELGPPHVVHQEIAVEGLGRFSHWNQTVIFSSSDNSSPMNNGREYRLSLPAYPTGLLNLLLLAMMVLSAAWFRLFKPVRRWFSKPFDKIMAVTFRQLIVVTGINIIVLALLLAGVELAHRLFWTEPPLHGKRAPGQYSKFAPYLMITNDPGLDTDGLWWDMIRKRKIPYHVQTNNLGFRMKRDLDVTTKYEKDPQEKVVLIFGGSAVFGFGNTSNETTIAGHLEKALNARQKEYIYTVFNLGNGGWVVFQEFIALILYGLNLNPDWIITMDGRNDIYAIPMVQNEDVGNHFTASTFRNYFDGYLYRQEQPDFFRGRLENWLIKHSFAYRRLTGKKYVPPSTPGFIARGRNWSDVDRTVTFYLSVQEAFLNACPGCRYILSTQPLYTPRRRLMTDEELKRAAEEYKDLSIHGHMITSPKFYDTILMYAYTNLIKKTKALCDRYPARCRYQAMDRIFPAEDREKKKYFVDEVHFTDLGNAFIADFYARTILEADLKRQD
ncbi:MAG: hypothetical protein AB1641_14420 [Thermodesulfobacteriota bacterium]